VDDVYCRQRGKHDFVCPECVAFLRRSHIPVLWGSTLLLLPCVCRSVQQATAISLAHLAPTGAELKSIFVDKPGLDVLLELLTDEAATASEWS